MSAEYGINPSEDFRQWTTESGRPVGELNANRELVVKAMDQKIPMREMICEIDDNRKNGWTNIDALEDLRTRFPSMLQFHAGVNVMYFGEEVPEVVDSEDAIALAQICIAMPGYLIAKQGYQIEQEIPNIVGDAFKINAGLHGAFTYFYIATDEEGIEFNSRNVYSLMNEHGMLQNEERVCPAPPSMIMRTIDALVLRQGAKPDVDAVNALFPDFEDLVTFSEVDRSREILGTPMSELS